MLKVTCTHRGERRPPAAWPVPFLSPSGVMAGGGPAHHYVPRLFQLVDAYLAKGRVTPKTVSKELPPLTAWLQGSGTFLFV